MSAVTLYLTTPGRPIGNLQNEKYRKWTEIQWERGCGRMDLFHMNSYQQRSELCGGKRWLII